jgi:precorrin-6B methylase 2
MPKSRTGTAVGHPRTHAWGRSAYRTLRRAGASAFVERPLGVDTARIVALADFGLADSERVDYEPSGWLDLRLILRRCEVSPDDVFIDFGSGKGRVLLQAAAYPFRRIIGVELSPQLTAIARANLDARSTRRRCEEVELVTADVLEYRIPDDVTVAYIYNAFTGSVFRSVIDQLVASVDRAPRRVRLIYRTALEEETLLATGRFREVRRLPGLRPSRAWSRKMATRMYVLDPLTNGSRRV